MSVSYGINSYGKMYIKMFQGSPDRKALSTLWDNTSNVPVSPTANLKLLTKVASELAAPVPSLKSKVSHAKAKETDSKTRKEKSLGILCDRFLAMFPLNLPVDCSPMEICLDQVAEQLGIVKRRIYDIINILESLRMASKVAKNRYQWHGCNNLQSTLSQLKVMAVEYGIDEKLQEIQLKQKNGFRLVSGPTCCCSKDLRSNVSSTNTNLSVDTDEKGPNSRSGEKFFSDERTLGVMCLKFIMLFLASPQTNAKINLDLATRMLVTEAADAAEREMWGMKVECHNILSEEPCNSDSKSCRCMLRLKTKVRRLYDIANVLTSLGLITKVETQTSSMRKPVFAYTGPSVQMASDRSIKSINLKSFVTETSCYDDEGVENRVSVSHKRKNSRIRDSGPPEKFSRISSENNLDTSARRCTSLHHVSARHVSSFNSVHHGEDHLRYQCSLDDILQVAGQELEKIRSSEEMEAAQKAFSARKKLSFSRCHSDSCIQPVPMSVKEVIDVEMPKPNEILYRNETNAGSLTQHSIEKEKSVCITLSESKSKRFTITRKIVEVPVNALPRQVTKDPSLNLHNITPMQANTLKTLFGIPTKSVSTVSSKHDNLISHSGADIVNNNKPAVHSLPKVLFNNLNRPKISVPNYGAASSSLAPGDLYRAIKVGNVVRLVPFITARTRGCDEQK